MRYCRSLDPIKIYPLRHSESFYLSLLLFFFNWWTKRWEITNEVLMNYNSLYLLCHANGQMYMYMIASSIKIINKCNVFLPCTENRFKLTRMVSCWDHMHVLGLWFVNTATAKIITKCICDPICKELHFQKLRFLYHGALGA